MRKKILKLLSFFIPLIFLTLIFYKNGLFLKNTIISGDMHAQYYSLFHYLKDLLNGVESIFYSLNKSLGGTMFGTFFYYLSSPLNLLIVFFSKSSIHIFMTILIMIKISLCGLTMYMYMSKKYNKDNFLILVFSLCYALMGYNINYFTNIMWLDVVILTPLVLLGIDRIIEEKKSTLYIILLSLSILSNYYIAYMLCLFCIIYFIYEISLKYKLKEDKEKIKKITKRLIISSLLSGLICSFFLIPCFIEMLNYQRGTTIKEIIRFDYNLFDIFSKTYIGSLDLVDTLNYSSMNIYCGIIILPLVHLYLINKKISKKERRNTLILIIFMILPCFVYLLNYIWHLFTVPSFYSYRYSFLLCFILINIAYKSYINLNISLKEILLFITPYSIISFYFVIITIFSKYYEFLNYKLIWITLLILGLYYLILLIKDNKKRNILLSLLLLIEMFMNVYIIFKNTEKNSVDIIDKSNFENIVNKYNKKERIEFKNAYITFNDSILLGYRGITNFLSTTNYNVIKILSILNEKIETPSNIYTYKHESYILDALMGIKIIITPNDIKEYKLIEQIEIDSRINKLNIYENPNSLGLGYMIKSKCNNIENKIFCDQKILNCVTNEDNEYYKEYQVDTKNRTIKITKNGYYYLYLDNIIYKDIILDEYQEDIKYYDKDYILLYNANKEKDLLLKENDIDISDLKAYYVDIEKINQTIETLKKEKLNYEINKNKIHGTITTKGGTLLITLPYEKGFTIKVNGNKVKYEKVLDSLIGIDLERGTHEITIEYKQPGLEIGIIISTLSIITTIIYVRKQKYEKAN